MVGGNTTPQKLPANVFEAVTLIHRRADHNTDPDIPFSNLMLMAVYESEAGKKGDSLRSCLFSWLINNSNTFSGDCGK